MTSRKDLILENIASANSKFKKKVAFSSSLENVHLIESNPCLLSFTLLLQEMSVSSAFLRNKLLETEHIFIRGVTYSVLVGSFFMSLAILCTTAPLWCNGASQHYIPMTTLLISLEGGIFSAIVV